MLDEITVENLQLISESLDLINKRFSNITQPDDFVLDDSGVMILDAIAMRLQVVGVKTIFQNYEKQFKKCSNNICLQ